jgi:hypothetical protein
MPVTPHYDFAHATAAIIAILALLSGLSLLLVKQVHEQVRAYGVQSIFAAGYTLLVGIDRVDAALIVLAVWTALIKVIVIPVAIDRAVTRQVSEHEVPLVVQVPMSLLIGVTLAGLAYWSASALPIHAALLPTPALGMPLSLLGLPRCEKLALGGPGRPASAEFLELGAYALVGPKPASAHAGPGWRLEPESASPICRPPVVVDGGC